MKKNVISIDMVKEKLKEYLDIPLTIRVNKGRNKIFYYDCKIKNLYPGVFQVELENNEMQTYSYSGVLCGEVKFKKREIEKHLT
ncbi:MAG: Veg family protein [Clostridia bacterium]|nr:Veg family protein [Clostridia bacterium]